MGETEFSVFAQKLAVKYKNGEKPDEFVKMLFIKIYLSDASVITALEDRTFRGYYYHQNDITELAQKISDDLDPANFASFIETDSDETIEYVCEAFKQWYPDINRSNYTERIAERFVTIINNAAAPKTKSNRRKTVSQISVFDPTPKDKYGTILVAEAGSVCPGEGCSNQLYVRNNGNLEFCYDVVVIDSNNSEDDVNNLIAMCPACAAKYRAGHGQSLLWLLKRKQQLQDSYEDRDLSSSEKIQDGVRRLLRKLPSMRPPSNIDLNYDPVPLKRKIDPDNVELYLRTKLHINAYFPDVHEALQDLGREGLLRFAPFCAQVRKIYLEYAEKRYEQPRIYREMTRWLHDGSGEEWEYCEIVISYFIQKCEVFDAITE